MKNKTRLFELMNKLDSSFNLVNEATAVPFKLHGKPHKNSHSYLFNVDDVEFVCDIFNNREKHNYGVYEAINS